MVVACVFVLVVMGPLVNVTRINASAQRDAAQQRSVIVVVSYSVLSVPVHYYLYTCSQLLLWTIVCLWG